MTLPQTRLIDGSPAPQYAVWLTEIADWLDERSDSLFACDCDAYMESDTGAWIHDDRCTAMRRFHIDAVLRSVAKHMETDL
jgi:hypothetical protein